MCFLFRHARLNGQRKEKKKKENVGWRRRAWIQPQRREERSSFTRVLGVGINGYPGHVIFSTFSLLLSYSAAFARFFFSKRTRNFIYLWIFVLKIIQVGRIAFVLKRKERMQQSIVLLLLVLAGLASASLNSTFTGEYILIVLIRYTMQSTSFIINTRRKKLNPTTLKSESNSYSFNRDKLLFFFYLWPVSISLCWK